MTKLTKTELLDYGQNIIFALGCTFVLTSLFAIIMQKLSIETFYLVPNEVGKLNKDIIYPCIFAPICEEFIFRWLPITAMIIIAGKSFEKWKWHYAAFLSIIFGAVHYGYFSIFIQGIFGFFVVYCYYNNKKYMYLSGVIMHMVWNFTLYYVLPTLVNFPRPNLFGY